MSRVRITAYVNMGDADRDKIWESALVSNNVVYLGAIQILRSKSPKTTMLMTIEKLTEELLTHVEKAKIDIFRWDEQASKRSSNFHFWLPKMKAITSFQMIQLSCTRMKSAQAIRHCSLYLLPKSINPAKT